MSWLRSMRPDVISAKVISLICHRSLRGESRQYQREDCVSHSPSPSSACSLTLPSEGLEGFRLPIKLMLATVEPNRTVNKNKKIGKENTPIRALPLWVCEGWRVFDFDLNCL